MRKFAVYFGSGFWGVHTAQDEKQAMQAAWGEGFAAAYAAYGHDFKAVELQHPGQKHPLSLLTK